MKAKLDGSGVETLASGMDKVSYPAGLFFFQVFFLQLMPIGFIDAQLQLCQCNVEYYSE